MPQVESNHLVEPPVGLIALAFAVATSAGCGDRASEPSPAAANAQPAAGAAPASQEIRLSEVDLELTRLRELGAAWYGEGDFKAGAWERAHELLEKVARHRVATPQDLVNLACAKLKLWLADPAKQDEETPRIRELCRNALKRDPGLASAQFVLGVVAFDRDQDSAAAVVAFERVVELEPDDVAARLRLAEALFEVDERDRAIEAWDSVVALGSDSAGAVYLPALYKLSRALRVRRGEGDLVRSRALLEEHTRRTASGDATASDDELKLGRLGRVLVEPPFGTVRPSPASAAELRFEPAPPLLAGTCLAIHAIDVADVNQDARMDLLVAGLGSDGIDGLWLLASDGHAGFQESRVCSGRFSAILAVDLDNEGAKHLLVRSGSDVRLLAPKEGRCGEWDDATVLLPPLPARVDDWQALDFGHDGLLDLAFATDEGLKLVRNDGYPIDASTRERIGPTRFTDVTVDADLPAGPVEWIAIEDLDGDRDIDLIVGGAGRETLVLSNRRRGRFERIDPPRSGLPGSLAREPLFADLDHDGDPDVLALGSPPQFSRNRGDGTFVERQEMSELEPIGRGPATLCDLDLDGELDFVGSDHRGRVVARLGPLPEGTGASVDLGALPVEGQEPLVADLDGDADLDLVAPASAGIAILAGIPPAANGSLLVRLRAGKDNRDGIGAIVEVRAADSYERRLCTRGWELFGLGPRHASDYVRVTWPNGIVQHEIEPAPVPGSNGRTILELAQKEGLVSSCPFLYSWNGERYEFVSDVLGITPLGLPMSDEAFVPPDHDELVRVTSAQLAAVEGELRFQVTEELREVTYLDRAQLWVVDHESGLEVHPEERFSFPPFPPTRLHTIRRAFPPAKVVDQAGRDWTDALSSIDDDHALPFDLLDPRYLGLATEHWLETTLPGAVRDAGMVRLLMTGWTYWTDASVNLLAARNGSIRFLPPVISVPDGAGGWRETGPPVGFPAGKTKTMVLDVTSLMNRDDPRLRITTTLRLCWDAIQVALDGGDAPLTVTKLEPARADLWHRGFSAPIPVERVGQPDRFDWSVLEPLPRWNQHRGMLTRYGDVRPLLGAIDDRFVIFSSGDAIDLRFDASGIAPVAAGMERTFLLFLDGWAKDADPNTVHGQTVEPLPFHGMSGYPYRSDERYPDDDFHVDYRLEWNTRPGRRLIESLAPRPFSAATR